MEFNNALSTRASFNKEMASELLVGLNIFPSGNQIYIWALKKGRNCFSNAATAR